MYFVGFIVLGLLLSWWRLKFNWRLVHFVTSSREVREKGSNEKACEKHMTGSWRVVLGCQFCEYFTGKAFPRYTRETLCLEDFSVWLSYPFTHTIYTLITHKCKGCYLERKTLDRFSTTHTHLFEREQLILSEKSL